MEENWDVVKTSSFSVIWTEQHSVKTSENCLQKEFWPKSPIVHRRFSLKLNFALRIACTSGIFGFNLCLLSFQRIGCKFFVLCFENINRMHFDDSANYLQCFVMWSTYPHLSWCQGFQINLCMTPYYQQRRGSFVLRSVPIGQLSQE